MKIYSKILEKNKNNLKQSIYCVKLVEKIIKENRMKN